MPPEALDRAMRSVEAARVLRAHRETITAACVDAAPGEIVAAVVGGDLGFAGVWTMPPDALRARFAELEGDGWLVTFAPGDDRRRIASRCEEMARLAAARAAALRRRAARRPPGA